LCKQVYNEMINNNDTFWDYDTLNLDILRDVTPDVSCFESQSQASLNSMFGKNTRNKMMLEVQTKSSLDLYQNCFVKICRKSYLCDNDFRSSRLKLLARTKTIPLKKSICIEWTCPKPIYAIYVMLRLARTSSTSFLTVQSTTNPSEVL
jgi:hypothetical protein